MNPVDTEDLMQVGQIDYVGFFPDEDECYYDGGACGCDRDTDGKEDEAEEE